MAALSLIPYPQHAVVLGGSVCDPEVVVRTDAALPAEGYRLRPVAGPFPSDYVYIGGDESA